MKCHAYIVGKDGLRHVCQWDGTGNDIHVVHVFRLIGRSVHFPKFHALSTVDDRALCGKADNDNQYARTLEEIDCNRCLISVRAGREFLTRENAGG